MSTGTETMKGAVIEEYNGPIVIRDDLKIPEPKPDQILVKVNACSLCMSDLGGYMHHYGDIAPYVPGHEPVGVVAKVGAGVSGFAKGDRVGFMPAAETCQNCDDCLGGAHRFCDKRINIGFNGLYGGFSEYCVADPLSSVKLPDGLSDEDAAPILCAGVTAYGALKKVSLDQPGGTLINVVGCGGVGHMVILFALAMGYRVNAFDVADEKLELAKKCGAEKTYNTRSMDISGVERAKNTLVVSAAAAAYDTALRITARRGKMVAIGHPHEPVPVNLTIMIMENISLVTTNQGTRDELRGALELAAQANIKPESEIRPLDEIAQGFSDLMGGKVKGRLVFRLGSV